MTDFNRIVPQPKNPVASFVDDYGETQIIHRKKGRRLSVFTGGNTPVLRMNRATAILIGRNIKARRLELGMSQTKLCVRAGLRNANPKQYVHAIEVAKREAGIRLGTLYAVAHALECEAADLMPTLKEVVALAGITPEQINALVV